MHDYLLQIYPSCVSPQSTQGKERVESVVGEKSFLATRNTHSLSPDVFADWSMIPRPASPGSRALFKLAAMSAADRGSGARRLERQGPPPVPAARHRSSHQLARRWPLPVQLCVVVLFFVLSLPVRVSSSITCAHANSTCSDCAVLCGVAQFYPLLPSPCHPDFPTVSQSPLPHFGGLARLFTPNSRVDTPRVVTTILASMAIWVYVRNHFHQSKLCPPPSLSRDPLHALNS